ncbi:MAG: polysaccharide biosynthesis protein [Gammaproteobacteria bacterium]|nr:MAG: polysaccharide biosynthesis protein [Gammaproteobacteria bacterium]
MDKRFLNILVIIVLSLATLLWSFSIFHADFSFVVVVWVVLSRIFASFLIFQDYSLSWSKATQKTYLIKVSVNFVAFLIYMPYFYGDISLAFFLSELFLYIFAINSLMYGYYYYINRTQVTKTKSIIIYGAGQAGTKLQQEYQNSQYKIKYFIDDDTNLQKRSIDGIKIISLDRFQKNSITEKYDLLVIAMPSVDRKIVNSIFDKLQEYFVDIKILPTLSDILQDKNFSKQLKKISVLDLLARHPQDLDQKTIAKFIREKIVLITGAGGSIGSELCRLSVLYNVKQLIMLDNSEYNLYQINEELKSKKTIPVMQSVANFADLEVTFIKYKPDIIIHAAAYKHVPMVEANMSEALFNNIIGTKNCIDLAIKYNSQKFILISTDKAVRPTNVMGASKRICEIYAQNVSSHDTEIIAVRFGNVLGSSGSVIPKFQQQIKNGLNLTVTHKDITRYFMLIKEACELVLQSASIGRGGEIFILDMGQPIKIADLAAKMINLSKRDDIKIKYTGLRAGEKLHEELLLDKNDIKTKYSSITVAKSTKYNINKLNQQIRYLMQTEEKLKQIKNIVPEFHHLPNN